jgi:acyl-CoA thioesterase-1
MKTFLLCLFLITIGCSDSGNKESTLPNSEDTSKLNIESMEPRIIFFGDSLTAGFGLDDYETSWPHLIQNRLAKAGHSFHITNAGVSGDTTSGGMGRIEWVLGQKPTIFVLELGANDMLRGIPPAVTKKNLQAMIQKVQSEHPNCQILLIGMQATPNMGKSYRAEFNSIYPDLAKEAGIALVPFLLEKVAGIRSLNQKDGIHPTKEGHVLLVDTVYPYILKLAEKSKKR